MKSKNKAGGLEKELLNLKNANKYLDKENRELQFQKEQLAFGYTKVAETLGVDSYNFTNADISFEMGNKPDELIEKIIKIAAEVKKERDVYKQKCENLVDLPLSLIDRRGGDAGAMVNWDMPTFYENFNVDEFLENVDKQLKELEYDTVSRTVFTILVSLFKDCKDNQTKLKILQILQTRHIDITEFITETLS